jgi:hypothetical protein
MGGMLTFGRLLLLFTLLVAALPAQSSPDHVRMAQARLGPDVWSRVITIENDARRSPYPKIVHALVFELAGILWFYTATDGTQSFSLHQDNLAAEKADFGPLLREIEPGFARWTEAAPAGGAPADDGSPLRNGCFIESVVALRERVGRGAVVEAPRLLSYYAITSAGRSGHTVLSYRAGGRVEILDPAQRERTFVFPLAAGADPLTLARALAGREVVQARYLALHADAVLAGLAGERTQTVSATGGV